MFLHCVWHSQALGRNAEMDEGGVEMMDYTKELALIIALLESIKSLICWLVGGLIGLKLTQILAGNNDH